MKQIIAMLFALVALSACSGGGGRAKQPTQEPKPVFLPALAPSALSDDEKIDYLRHHYWDKFDFTDTTFVRRADTLQMIETYARYVQILFSKPTDAAPIAQLMARAATSRPMMDYFVYLAEQVLHEPNSPLRNDELYIPVLQAQLAAPWYDEYERIGPEYELQLALQNRIGHVANDFGYTLASGAVATLHGLKAQYTLLFFSTPGCPMCGELREEISASPMLNELQELGRLQILVLYPDEDVDEWRSHGGEIPSGWINAYDDGCRLRAENLYNLSAIPSLYLLDAKKRVLVKDSVSVPEIEEALADD